MTLRRSVFALLPLLALAGCGGDGTGRGQNSPLTEIQTRILRPGDSWQYNVTIVSVTGSGTTTESVVRDRVASARDFQGRSLLAVSEVATGEAERFTVYEQNSATRAYTLEGFVDPDGTERPVTEFVQFPGTFGQNTTYSDLNLNGSDTFTLTVTGQETITVPAGTFKAWKATGSYTLDGMTANVTEWTHPGLGLPIKRVLVFQGQGVTDTETTELQSTNIDLDPSN